MARRGLDAHTVLQAAATIADREGAKGLSLAVLARELQVRTPSLYNHIEGLPDLYNRLSAYGLEKLHERLAAAATSHAGEDALRAIATAYIAFARAHPGLYELTLAAPNPGATEVAAMSERIIALLQRVLQEAYGMQQEETLHRIRGLRSMLHGFATLEQRGGFGLPLDLDTSFLLLIETYLAGLAAQITSS